MAGLNLYSDMSSIAQSVQDDAIFVIRESYIMPSLVKPFNDLSSSNPRVGYKYNQGTAGTLAEADDLTSSSFIPSADQTLTPREFGLQFFISDQRADSSGNLPEDVLVDAARELGMAAGDKIQQDLLLDMGSLTAGTVGGVATVPTWGHLAAAIAQARQANKSSGAPIKVVMHGYQWAKLASLASIAGATVAVSPGYTEEVTRTGFVATFMGAQLYQVYAGTPAVIGTGATAWFSAGVFAPDAIAIDWRRPIRVRPQRDESRRGVELNMTGVYAHGLWRPDRGMTLRMFATAPNI